MLNEIIYSFHSLKVNFMTDPVGVEDTFPSFSWQIDGIDNKDISNYIVELRDEISVIWKKKIAAKNNNSVVLDEDVLLSQQHYFWRVIAEESSGNRTSSSDAAFTMGILHQDEWTAKWISATLMQSIHNTEKSAPYFRKTFNIDGRIKRAILTICGLGYYEAYINGRKVTSDVLTPCFSNYDKSSFYNTYDVSGIVDSGKNAIGVILGNGLYDAETKNIWNFETAPWRHHPKFIMQLKITLEDGQEVLIKSDNSFKFTNSGPIIFNALRNGEYYDARRELSGWCEADYDDSNWSGALYCLPSGGLLRSEQTPPIKKISEMKPVLVNILDGKYIFDIGQNISGFARIKMKGKSGQEITIRYGEKLKDDGSLDQSNLDLYVYSGDFQTDRYIFKGEGIEEWEARFTYHGFRYVEISGYDEELSTDNLTAIVVHTAFEVSGSFKCSNELINNIQNCVLWSTITNFHSIPTDCPHREKNGWTGDAQLSAEHTIYNYFAYNSYIRWLDDIVDTQRPNGQICSIVPTGGWGYVGSSGPAWDSALVIIPKLLVQFYNDKRVYRRYYNPIKKYVEYMMSMEHDGIVEFGLGDWCPPTEIPHRINCSVSITDTAYYYFNLITLSDMALVLGEKQDYNYFKDNAERIKTNFREKFINEDYTMVSHCQTAYACALYFDIADDSQKPEIAKLLNGLVIKSDYHLDCGILGTKYILEALSKNGYPDTAYRIVTQTSYPSWGDCINKGATTFWETWEGNASMNHHMFASVGTWFYKYLAGININGNDIIIDPYFIKEIDFVEASYISIYGEISVSWKREGARINISIKIPSGVKAHFQNKNHEKSRLKAGISNLLINI